MKDKIIAFFHRPIWSNYRFLLFVWAMLGLITGITRLGNGNNYKVFAGMFWHALHQLPLYAEYPAEYYDIAHYGPAFSVLVAPFALCPFWLGLILWNIAISLSLWWAVRTMPLSKRNHIFIFWIVAIELVTALVMHQFNIVTAALICATFTLIEKKRDFWAALCIVVGTFVKLYGIVGLAFFFFSKKKLQFIVGLAFWSVVMFVLPMLISSPDYIIGQYGAWATDLIEKNQCNLDSFYQNLSLLGFVRRNFGYTGSDLWLIVPGIVLFCLPYLRFRQWQHQGFRYAFLESVLMFVVLFSTGSESSGYIIAFTGVALWYVTAPWQRGKADLALLIFAFIFTTLSHTDMTPSYLQTEFIRPRAVKVFPVILVWFKLIWEMMTCDYTQTQTQTSKNSDS